MLTLILAHRNRDVWALNAGVREALQAAGALAAGEPFRTARGDRAFAAGDRILFLKNDRTLGVKNGMISTVAQAGRGRIEVRLLLGELSGRVIRKAVDGRGGLAGVREWRTPKCRSRTA